MMKKILLTVCISIALLFALSIAVIAASDVGGDCSDEGSDVKWSFDTSNGELTISGSGNMKTWSDTEKTPWYEYSKSIKKVTVEKGVTSLSKGALEDCTAIERMTLPFVGDRRVAANGAVDGLTDAEAEKREKINGRLAYLFGESAIPATLKSLNITDCETIETEALANCTSLTELQLPENLKFIKDGAFFSCSGLSEVKLPAELTEIGKAAFAGCTKLTSVAIPDKVTAVGETAFFGCVALNEFSLGASVEALGEGILYSCSALEKLTVSTANKKFYSQNNCIVEKISKKLIIGCKSSVVPSNVLIIGEGAFRNCNGLEAVTLPDGLIAIEKYAFENCVGLTEIILPSSLKTVEDYAFAECRKITTVKAPSGVKYGEGVFKNCISMLSEDMPTFEKPMEEIGCNGLVGMWICLAAVVLLIVAGAVALVLKKRK